MAGRPKCRLHGGKNFLGAPGKQNALKHGRTTAAALAAKREASAKARAARQAVKDAVAAADEAVAGFQCEPVDKG
jgi:hypothetical protein